ncbi:hypothetical protein TWF694_001324 [Orbilia ellipsospora]|uniref:Uncharacterized protein n=1 Tax=Orbilia ellipsospora TaxID=2528407 RepID=A0AAV9XS23_9PEZI
MTKLEFTALLLTLSTISQATTIKLTTAPPIPTAWTVSSSCFDPSSAVDVNGGVIWNVGCGKSYRQNCCPPSYSVGVIFATQTAAGSPTGSGGYGCPNGYVGNAVWGDFTGMPDTTGTRVCCPSGITFWSTFGAAKDALCYTQTPFSGSLKLSQDYWVSTYARPFFIAAQASGNVPASTTSSSGSDSTGIGATTGSSSQVAETTNSSAAKETSGTSSPENSKSGLGPGAIAGIVLGVVAGIALGIIAFIVFRRRRDLGMVMHVGGTEDPPVPPPANSQFYGQSNSSGIPNGVFKTPPPPEEIVFYEYNNQYSASELALTGAGRKEEGIINRRAELPNSRHERKASIFENAEKVPSHTEHEELLRRSGH